MTITICCLLCKYRHKFCYSQIKNKNYLLFNNKYLKFKDITRDEYGNLTRNTSVRYDYSKKKESSIYKKLENKYEYYK